MLTTNTQWKELQQTCWPLKQTHLWRPAPALSAVIPWWLWVPIQSFWFLPKWPYPTKPTHQPPPLTWHKASTDTLWWSFCSQTGLQLHVNARVQTSVHGCFCTGSKPSLTILQRRLWPLITPNLYPSWTRSTFWTVWLHTSGKKDCQCHSCLQRGAGKRAMDPEYETQNSWNHFNISPCNLCFHLLFSGMVVKYWGFFLLDFCYNFDFGRHYNPLLINIFVWTTIGSNWIFEVAVWNIFAYNILKFN